MECKVQPGRAAPGGGTVGGAASSGALFETPHTQLIGNPPTSLSVQTVPASGELPSSFGFGGGFAGVKVICQFGMSDPGGGFALSNGLRVRLGSL